MFIELKQNKNYEILTLNWRFESPNSAQSYVKHDWSKFLEIGLPTNSSQISSLSTIMHVHGAVDEIR